MDPTIRLRIATRIHFALLRHFDENIAVGTLLKGEAEAREALWVCEASGNDELVALAKRFRSTHVAAAPATPSVASAARPAAHAPNPGPARGAEPQDLAWSHDTSGFGLSRPPETSREPFAKNSGWLIPSRWLRPASAR